MSDIAIEGEPTPPTLVGPESRIGRYRLCFEVASGGMATVYLARVEGPAGFEKLVAVKRIHRHLAKERAFVEMFLDEARLASRMQHSNVCSVFDFGEADGAYFLAMEYLHGESVARVFRRLAEPGRRLDPGRVTAVAARIVADACEGLHSAHELRSDDGALLGVVHRDVSPQNLFVTYDGIVKVVDFGIARAAGKLHHTQTGAVKGKWAYMAPEQARRVPVDRRADVWSLGVVLWELVTGQRLFRREDEVETLMALINDPILPPSKAGVGVPRYLDAVVLAALERDPDRRIPTARDFGRELQRLLVKAGASVGPAEVAEWMRELFPEELARRNELVEQARRPALGAVPKVSERLAGGGSGSPVTREVPEAASELLTRALPRRSLLGPWRRPLIATALVIVLGAALWVVSRSPATVNEPVRADVPSAPAATSAAPAEPPPPPSEVPAPPAAAAEPVAEPEPPAKGTTKLAARVDPPPAGPPGTVNVAAVGGWADIVVDGRRRGRTPAQFELPAGRHVIELRPFGEGPPRRRQIRVRAGRTERVVVEL